MAELIDDELPGEDIPAAEEPVKQPEAKKEETPEIPEKYRGKSLDDIVRMHQEAEKLIGKHAQEVGEVRKLADELLKQQLSGNKKEPDQQEEEIDFFADPKKAVEKAVENHPAVVKAQKAAEDYERSQRSQKLHQRHPDMAQIVQSPEFVEFVKASERRMRLFQEADQKYDTEAADDLLTSFKELRTLKTQQTKNEGEEIRNQTLKDAAVDTGGTGETVRKVYRRADLIRLKIRDPERYDAMQDEILAAYSEGRVK